MALWLWCCNLVHNTGEGCHKDHRNTFPTVSNSGVAGCQQFNIRNGPLEFLLQPFCRLRRILCQFWKNPKPSRPILPHSLGIKVVWKTESTLCPKRMTWGFEFLIFAESRIKESVLKLEQKNFKSVSGTTLCNCSCQKFQGASSLVLGLQWKQFVKSRMLCNLPPAKCSFSACKGSVFTAPDGVQPKTKWEEIVTWTPNFHVSYGCDRRGTNGDFAI